MKRISLLLLSLMLVGVCAAQVDSVRIANIEGKVAVLESSINELGVARSDLKGELQTIASSTSTYQLKVDQKLIELDGAITDLSSAIDDLKGRIGAVKSDIAKRRKN
jgi:peptidoglycan hydrolase CwlO-like protein